MDDARRQVLMAELDDAKKELDRLTSYVQVLSTRLGVSVEDGSGEQAAEANGGAIPQGDPVSLIYEGELVGKSLPKAAAEVIRRYSPAPHKRPIRTPVLVKALQKGGLPVKDPRQLYRTLYNTRALTNISGGQWGLAEWYPDKVKAKAKGSVATDSDLDTDSPAASAEGAETTEEDAS